MKTYYNDVSCAYDNIIFDLDSTLVTIEGIDELARIKGVESLIEPMTHKAMNGELSIEDAFTQRLAIINPTLAEVSSLAQLYTENITIGVREVISWLQAEGKQIFIVSGGYDPAVSEFAQELGIPRNHVFANRLTFDVNGLYTGLLEKDYLWKTNGKKLIVAEILQKYPGKTAMIGDGMSDLEAAEVVDTFICFAGVARREAVTQKAECVVTENNLSMIMPFLSRSHQ